MKIIFDSRFKTEVALLGQGEYHVSNSGIIMTTTLGSCIAVCLFDGKNGVGGMNHYMLPEAVLENGDLMFGKAKYGINSMEVLINEMIKLGAVRENLRAKIFGGARMFSAAIDKSITGVGEQNIVFANKYLDTEKISIVSKDVGGDHARKIYFDSKNGFVKLFRIGQKDQEQLKQEEAKYQATLKDKDEDDKITFF